MKPSANEQARAEYIDREMRHMKSVCLPSSIPPSDDRPLEEDDLYKGICDYCSRIEDHRKCQKDMHYVTLNSIKEYKARQELQGKKVRDEVYQKMSQNLERVREVARHTMSRASMISAEEHRMKLSETDFINIKKKMNKIDQRIDGLYQNWQAEYKEAITTEQCEEIQRFYEPYVMKYETKYKILYQMLQQAISDKSRVPSSRISSRGLTPSLMALEDALTLKKKEWNRGVPGEDTHQMYTMIGGSLTPTALVYDDMRTDLTLNVPANILAVVGGSEERESTQLPKNDERGSATDVATSQTEVPETSPKVMHEGLGQEGLPGRNEVTRENSREDALAVTRLFFNTIAERRNMNEVPTTTTVSVSQIDTPPVLVYR